MTIRLLALGLLVTATPAVAALSANRLATVAARPPAGARLPADLRFTDVGGRSTTLGAAAAGHPAVLVFADYTCRHVCAPGLALTAATLRQSGLRPGIDYRLVVVGLDPRDRAADARATAAKLGSDLARSTTWLLGDARATPAAARALGYGYVYDAGSDQFAHDASAHVFAPDGSLRALLPELALAPEAVRAALTGASAPPSLGERVAHLCYGFAAAKGRYGSAIVRTLQALSALLLICLGVFLLHRTRAA